MIIDGKSIAEKIKNSVKSEAELLAKSGTVPGLAVIMVGNNSASRIYVNNKKRACEEVGIRSEKYLFPESISQKELLEFIKKLNCDKNIHGILVQLPLPTHIDDKIVAESISPQKDVDVFNPVNVGKLALGNACLLPCTPAGIIEILRHQNIEIAGKSCAIIGRSNIVGKPTALLLLENNATVTVCHSKTKNLAEICKKSDIIVSAVGKPKFITSDMIKKGSVIIDVGMNRNKDGKVCGDVDFESAQSIASYITPVPGGVGPMTIAMLMKNTISAAKAQIKRS